MLKFPISEEKIKLELGFFPSDIRFSKKIPVNQLIKKKKASVTPL
jgi:hypothetical protein